MSVEAILSDLGISKLNDDELQEELQLHGVTAGPIVVSTRRIYQKKLAALMGADLVDSSYRQDDSMEEINGSDNELEISNASVNESVTEKVAIREFSPQKVRQRAPQYDTSFESPLTVEEELCLSFDRNRHAPAPRPSLRSPLNRTVDYDLQSYRNFVKVQREEQGADYPYRFIVKCVILLALVVLVYLTFMYSQKENPYSQLKNMFKKTVNT